MALTPKQEKFCQGIVSGLNQSDAYRSAYNCEGMQPETINNNAYKLTQDNDIATRIEHLRKPIAERVGRTLEQHIARMLELASRGDKLNKIEAAIKAEELVGKALGYYVNKTELTGRDGGKIETVTEIVLSSPEIESDDTTS